MLDAGEFGTLRGFYVYRLWGVRDVCLYVGMSTCPSRRIRDHHSKSWWPQVVRVEVAECPNEDIMRDLEREQTRIHRPLYCAWFRKPGINWNEFISQDERAAGRLTQILSKLPAEEYNILRMLAIDLYEDERSWSRIPRSVAAQIILALIDHENEPATGVECEICYKTRMRKMLPVIQSFNKMMTGLFGSTQSFDQSYREPTPKFTFVDSLIGSKAS